MIGFLDLVRRNRNYRYVWTGQVVSEIGDHFNNIAVFTLALRYEGPGLVVSGVMLSRAIPAIVAGPLAGVFLDRWDRRKIMIASDLIRCLVALGFVVTLANQNTWLLYLLSAILMFASPFFTAGRSAILPRIASEEELHAATSLTQTTQWISLIIGTFTAGAIVSRFGFPAAFIANALSFLVSGVCIWLLKTPAGFRARHLHPPGGILRPWGDYSRALNYMRSNPLVLGIALIGVGWATGGGAAQILFTLFGELVFHRGAAGIATIWGSAGIGLLLGGTLGYWIGARIRFKTYTWTIVVCYVVHGGAYVIFSQMQSFTLALIFIALSRAAVAVSSVLNYSQLLRYVPDEFRGRVFATNESMVWATMLFSMALAGIASQYYNPRLIGAVSGLLSSTTAIFWGWAIMTNRLPDPAARAALAADPQA
ncbi:MAG: MFS transporter [Acidobacteria bacterium]|nr:MAG: MFS transporter [Acidobacteriota bacterium]